MRSAHASAVVTTAAITLAAVGLFGCASRSAAPQSGQGDVAMVDLPPGEFEVESETVANRVDLPEVPAKPLHRPLPDYPDVDLTLGLSGTVTVLYHVQKDGIVSVQRMEWDEEPAAEKDAFEQEIRAALETWKYEPAMRHIPTRQPDGSVEPIRVVIPKAMQVSIRFRVVDGVGLVE